MTSLERVFTAVGHKEPDRIPLMLMLSLQGAKESGLSIEDYFTNPHQVAEMKLKLGDKYENDCYSNFYYASIEIEAFGGTTHYVENGPPNSGVPIIQKIDQIKSLQVPDINYSKCLQKVLTTTIELKKHARDKTPIIGIVIAPFSLPVMQMGFDNYLDLMYGNYELFLQLMAINEKFCVNWANAQIDAGATAIAYFDPVSSPTISTRDWYLKTGYKIAKRCISKIKGPTATLFASGRCLPIIDDIAQTGTAILGVSSLEEIGEVKEKCKGKLAVLGNLNGVEMCNWTPEIAEKKVKNIIDVAGQGGGLLICDNHGEIPYQVSEEVLFAISEAVHKYGTYPLVKKQIE